MLSGVAFILSSLLPPQTPGSIGDALWLVAIASLAVGIVGFHALQKDHYGRIGRAGFYTVIVAALAEVLGLIVLLLGSTALEWLIFPIGTLGVLVGLVLYGAATLQARVLPRWVGVGLIVGLPIRLALLPIERWGLTLFGLLWVALGYVLWSRREAATEQPARVS
jgi:FtsH-binding integral membrane protein